MGWYRPSRPESRKRAAMNSASARSSPVGLGMPVLGYYSHVDVETKETAEAAGVDLVVPRSRMARELPALAERLLDA